MEGLGESDWVRLGDILVALGRDGCRDVVDISS
jgi:hypothetical protein